MKEAEAAGVSVALDGTNLRVSAKRKPPAPILDDLRKHKAEIITLLAHGSDSWSPEDWRTFYDERAAIAQYDGCQTREQAERAGFKYCIVEWLDRHPQSSDPGRCAWCGQPDTGHAVVPFGTENQGHTWLHPSCWEVWHRDRREKAQRALAAMGLVTPPACPQEIESLSAAEK
jgi:hypothetical protein